MKALTQARYGGPEVLEITEMPTPVPGENEVLIRIVATVATPSDIAFRSGEPKIARLFSGLIKPRIRVLGDSIAGIVEAVGGDVTRFRVGDRVFGSTGPALGAYAECTCRRGSASAKPPALRTVD